MQTHREIGAHHPVLESESPPAGRRQMRIGRGMCEEGGAARRESEVAALCSPLHSCAQPPWAQWQGRSDWGAVRLEKDPGAPARVGPPP